MSRPAKAQPTRQDQLQGFTPPAAQAPFSLAIRPIATRRQADQRGAQGGNCRT